MYIYTFIIISLTFISLAVHIHKRDENAFGTFLGVLALVPIFGRVLGWW